MILAIPDLLFPMLASSIPSQVWGGGLVTDPPKTLFIWRTTATERMRNSTLGFYVWDERLEPLWANPDHYTRRFREVGIAALIEADFSLWADAPIDEQKFNVFRSRTLARRWQEAGIPVIPSLNWSDEQSFSFAFAGIPFHPRIVGVESRTPSGNPTDRLAFLRGLHEGVRRIQPVNVIVYGGHEHRRWLLPNLPDGPRYTLLPSWQTERERWRKQQAHRYQLNLFAKEAA